MEGEQHSDSDLSDSWTLLEPDPEEGSLDVIPPVHVQGSPELSDGEESVNGEETSESSDGESVEILDFHASPDERVALETHRLENLSEEEEHCSHCMGESSSEDKDEDELADNVYNRIQDSSEIHTVSGGMPQRVYRHCRNNLLNTILSLAVGVVFASVACIALGHFLGVQDAEFAAEEMVVALKNLQKENIQLHSKLTSIDKDWVEADVDNSLPQPDGPETQDITFLSEMPVKQALQMSLKIQLANMTQVLNNLYQKIIFLKSHQVSANFEKWDFKLSQAASKFLKKESMNLRKYYKFLERFSDFDERMNNKMCKLKLTGFNINCDNSHMRYLHGNLNVFQWFPKAEVTLYEKYSQSGNAQNKLELNSKEEPENEFAKDEENVKTTIDIAMISNSKDKEGIAVHEEQTVLDRKCTKTDDKEYLKVKESKRNTKKCDCDKSKKYLKAKQKYDDDYKKDKKLKIKKREEKRSSIKNKKNENKGKKPPPLVSSQLRKEEHYPGNCTGQWVFKMSKGRNDFRKRFSLDNWFLERGRRRSEDRNDSGYWQFARSVGRRMLRDDAKWWFRRSEARNHFRNDYSSDTLNLI